MGGSSKRKQAEEVLAAAAAMAAAATPQQEPRGLYQGGELDLFSHPPMQNNIAAGYWNKVSPSNNMADTTYLEFEFTPDNYVDLSSTYLNLRVKISDARPGNHPIADACNVAGTNNWLHSMFSRINMEIDGVSVTTPNDTYPYRAYLETVLSYGADAKKTYLQSQGFYKDEAGHMDTVSNNNKGYRARRELAQGGKLVELKGRLHLDMFQQPRLIPKGTKLKFTLYRTKDDFCLTGRATDGVHQDDHMKAIPRLDIERASLDVRMVELSKLTAENLERELLTTSMRYPVKRVVVKAFGISQGKKDHDECNIFSGQLPTRVTVACVTSDAYVGQLNRNPFNFQHFNCTNITLKAGGTTYPKTPLNMDFGRDLYNEAYFDMTVATGQYGSDEGNYISRKDFGNGYTIYCFNLKPDMDVEDNHVSPMSQGSVELNFNFANELPQNVTVLVMGEFDNTIEISRFRGVSADYHHQ